MKNERQKLNAKLKRKWEYAIAKADRAKKEFANSKSFSALYAYKRAKQEKEKAFATYNKNYWH